ncbi:hypothetical protein OF829_16405 [Sphingomonas sp. LB-2]|uniref:hypothetical protein n=1 Tax=Sphingomonas caeni TaxID=2984949 RepID=UPI00222F089E|nr:hypothetical protein [Sphingomonas caeni]MCW3848821.1 hypothetical protein [Sphingomonas caeni]
MRRIALFLAPTLVAVTGIAPAHAQADRNDPIACIYRVYHKSDWAVLVKVVRQGLVGQTGDEKAEVDRIGAATKRCRSQYGWGKKKEDLALRWFAGRVLSGDATFNLKKYGFDFEKLQALVARLDAPTRAAYLSGQVSNEQSQATLAALAAVGIDFASIPAEDRAMFAQKLSQGILGLVLQQEAEAAFSA